MLRSNEKTPIDRREPEVTEFAIEQGEQRDQALLMFRIACGVAALFLASYFLL